MLRCPRSPRSPRRQRTTKTCLRPTSDRWPFHGETCVKSCDSETLNFFHLHRRLFLFLSGFSLASVPQCPAVCRHLQHLPELGLHRHSSVWVASESSRPLLAVFSLLLFSLAATVNIHFQCINILLTCC